MERLEDVPTNAKQKTKEGHFLGFLLFFFGLFFVFQGVAFVGFGGFCGFLFRILCIHSSSPFVFAALAALAFRILCIASSAAAGCFLALWLLAAFWLFASSAFSVGFWPWLPASSASPVLSRAPPATPLSKMH